MLFLAAGLQKNQGRTLVTELLLKKEWRPEITCTLEEFSRENNILLSRQQVRTQQEQRADGLWVLLRAEPEGVAHLRCHGQAFSWQL